MQVNLASGGIDIRWKNFVGIEYALRVKLALDVSHQFHWVGIQFPV